MKRLLIAALFVATPVAHAGDIQLCIKAANLAETTMRARQNGISLAQLVATAHSSPSKTIAEFTTALAQDAFATPRFHTEENKQRAIVEFGSKTMSNCLEARRRK